MPLKNKNMLDLEQITKKVREIALQGGAFLRNERSSFDRGRVEKKNAHDYVSYVDKESERRIVAQLRELLPEAGFIAEEGSGSLTDEEYCWLVDPLDGTTNFILTKMDKEGESFENALKEAQNLGYAERNPEADVEGHDTCRKIAILTSMATGKTVNYEDI